MKQRSSHHIFGIVTAILFLLCGVTSFTGCANDATVATPKIADSLDIMTGCKYNGIVGLSPDGTRVAVWYPGSLQVFETSNGKLVSEFKNNPQDFPDHCEFSVDNKRFLLSSNYSATVVYDVSQATANILLTLPSVTDAHLFDDGTKIIAGGAKGSNPPSLTIYSIPNGNVLTELHPKNFYNGVYGLGFLRVENYILYGTEHSECVLWSISTDKEVSRYYVQSIAVDLLFSEEGQTLTYNSENGVFPIYDTRTGKIISIPDLHNYSGGVHAQLVVTKDFVYAGKFLDIYHTLLAVQVLNIADGSVALSKQLPDSVSFIQIAASRQQNCVAVLLTNGLVRLWRM